MNFNDINKIYNHLSTSIYPNVKCVWENVSTEELLIDRYLTAVDSNQIYKLLAVPYLFDAEKFLKKYLNNCIIFYNTPNPQDGLILTIHQISPSLHISSRLFCWVENEKVHDYLLSSVFYKNYKDALKFIQDNSELKREGNTEERETKGFNVGFK